MRRRVLVVTSAWAPATIADMHRARQLAWDLPGLGWQVHVLCPDGSYQPMSCMDPDSDGFFAPDAGVHAVPQPFARLFAWLGMRGIGWRALLPMLFAGRSLIRRTRIDLVYLSTTQFPLFLLGPAWRAWTGVPYVLDLHDPVHKAGSWMAPGLRHSIGRWLAKRIESVSIRAAAGLVAVSPEYVRALLDRYPAHVLRWAGEGRNAVIPFGVLPQDFVEAARTSMEGRAARDVRRVRIVYVGAGGPVMLPSFRVLCRALAQVRGTSPEVLAGVCIELFGTMLGWKEGDTRHLAEVAREEGVEGLVHEAPGRVTYRRSVELLLEGDGVLVLGVDDAGYMPSKLFGYAYSGKPLLAVLREDSAAFRQVRDTAGFGHAVGFGTGSASGPAEAAREVAEFLREAASGARVDRRALLEPWLSGAMARRHAELFEASLRSPGSPAERRA